MTKCKSFYDGSLFSFLLTLMTVPSLAQTENKDALLKVFQQYQREAFQEKVFVHVDRSLYLAGETIWFKVYDVDGYFNKPLGLSGVTYVEVLNKDQQPALQAKVEMKDGKGMGSFQIPASLLSGNYILRAYTSWMKNFSPDFYFNQPLTVINTLTEPPPSLPKGRDTGYGARTSMPDIQFFPEGGNLVYGLPSKMAFKAVNSLGDGIYCKGVVVNQKNDTVSRFQAARFGMGNFPFTPLKGDSYRALVEINDSVMTRKLPAIYDQGYTMNLIDTDQDKLKVVLHSNMPAGNQGVYLFVHSRQLVKNVQAGLLVNNECVFYVDKKSLGDGVSHITLFNADKSPVCERLYFNQGAGYMRIEAKTDQSVYQTRKKIDIDLSTLDQSGHPLQADLSLSVFWIDSLQSLTPGNILTYLLMTSDLKGKIESPQYYFENAGAETIAAVDNLMLTQGWTRFRWETVLANKKPLFEFLPEPDGPLINGKVIDKRTGRSAPPVTGYLSIPGKYFTFSSAVSRPNGDIRFNVKKNYGNNEIIVQTNSQTDSNDRIDISNPYAENFSSYRLPDFIYPEKWKSQLLYRSINAQVENAYLISQKHRLAPGNLSDTLPFYGKPDLQYNLDDYTRFITLEEVIREYVLDVHLRQQSGKYDFRIRNSLFNTFFDDAPLLLLDGTPLFDADKIVAMDPLQIKTIEVVKHRYYTNSLVSDGILSYKTYEGDLGGYPLDPNAVVVQYAGLQQQREFYAPVYDDPTRVQSPVPDFRNLLLWSPDIKTDEKGDKRLSFYASDLAGTFVLVVQGITDEGLPGSAVRSFAVTK
jgi:hypothetical protein